MKEKLFSPFSRVLSRRKCTQTLIPAFSLVKMKGVSRCGVDNAGSIGNEHYDGDVGCEPRCRLTIVPKTLAKHPQEHYKHAAFSLVEMLMALLVASLLMVAMAPVITKRFNETYKIDGVMASPELKKKTHEITFGSVNCPNDASHLKTAADGSQYCEGEFVVPNGYNGTMIITLVGAGGGGAGGATAGFTEYKTAGTYTFTTPKTADKLEVTLVEGGAGGGAGWINTTLKGFSWSYDATSLNRTYVTTSNVISGATHKQVSGSSVSSSYSHGTGTLTSTNTKYLADGKAWVTMAGGGGGGGRGYSGTGGGGAAAYARKLVSVSKGGSYAISVGAGGAKHACDNGMGGCGGSASKFGSLLTTGGGGGGGHGGASGCPSTAGENGGAKSADLGSCKLTYAGQPTRTCSGGRGAGNSDYNAPDMYCDPSKTYISELYGWNGGKSMFGTGGVYSTTDTMATALARKGQGYGAGGCGAGGTGAAGSPEANFAGDGAPGFVAVEFYEYASGGAGGAGASILALSSIAVTPNEGLTLIVGAGGTGGKKGSINGVGSFTYPVNAINGRTSFLKRGETIIGRTSYNSDAGCNSGACAGNYNGNGYSASGHIYTTFNSTSRASGEVYRFAESTGGNVVTDANRPGFEVTGGYSAGNKYIGASNGYGKVVSFTPSVTDFGGDGGRVKIFGHYTCTSATGGRSFGAAGASATGNGCGGAGGYGMADGGNGSDGYARISWNKTWQGTNDGGTYKLADLGNGGGGASGNVLRASVSVKSGEVIKVRIGKGGKGGYWSSGSYVEAVKGGNTEFDVTGSRHLIAGGGYGGLFPMSGNVLGNGTGGAKSTLCKIGATNYADNYSTGGIRCLNGTKGGDASETKGGAGADAPTDIISASGSTFGRGGIGADRGSGDTNGAHAASSGFGGGGGGAGLKDLNETGTSVAPSTVGSIGGDGANGKIVIDWYE